MKLKVRLSLFNLFSKLVFTAIFLLLMSFIIERINLRQVDNDLIHKREQVITLISEIGIEPFITSDSSDTFGSYNILKEEFISLERIDPEEEMNFIEVTSRLIEDEEIDYRILNYSIEVDGQKYLLEVGKSLQSIVHTGRNIRQVMLVFLISIIILTFIADYQYTRLLLRPLEKIRNKLKRISDPSLFDMSPVSTTTSDFLQLDSALRELMSHINLLFQKEKEITVNISHELLTPVSVLRSKLENILLREDLDPEIEAKTEESLKTLHRLQSLINSMLMIARIESHQYLREDTFSINEILTEIINEINPVAEDAGIMIMKELHDDYQLKQANRSLIFSMFYNIVNNAVKNSPADGHVLIKSVRQKNRYIILISDTGPGLTEIQKQFLFSRFKMRNKDSGEGTGIGLAIAKTIADFHNLEVKVDSEPGQSTKISFIFPEIS
jgi:signal transduction histidine kinase